MTIRDRMEIYFHAPDTVTPMCANCAHYYPHYNLDGDPFHCGHCCYPRIKPRKAYDFCEHFQNKSASAPDCNRNGG